MTIKAFVYELFGLGSPVPPMDYQKLVMDAISRGKPIILEAGPEIFVPIDKRLLKDANGRLISTPPRVAHWDIARPDCNGYQLSAPPRRDCPSCGAPWEPSCSYCGSRRPAWDVTSPVANFNPSAMNTMLG